MAKMPRSIKQRATVEGRAESPPLNVCAGMYQTNLAVSYGYSIMFCKRRAIVKLTQPMLKLP